jgi:hypothetical protein
MRQREDCGNEKRWRTVFFAALAAGALPDFDLVGIAWQHRWGAGL